MAVRVALKVYTAASGGDVTASGVFSAFTTVVVPSKRMFADCFTDVCRVAAGTK